MCNPVVAMWAMAATTAVSAYGQYQQGQYQSKVAKNNAITQQRMADSARQVGESKELRHRQQVALMKSRQRAALGASGRDMSGSALGILDDTTTMGELDALTIRHNSEMEAYGHQVGAVNSMAQSGLSSMQGNYGAASTILSGSGRVAGHWYSGRR